MQPDQRKKSSVELDFFTEYDEGSIYRIEEVIGKGSYGVVCSAYDTHTGEKLRSRRSMIFLSMFQMLLAFSVRSNFSGFYAILTLLRSNTSCCLLQEQS